MPDKPILIFPAASVAARQSLGSSFSGSNPKPSKKSQADRLEARFQALESTFGQAQATPDGVDPEQVIVLEAIGSVDDFQSVAKRIPGMEWLGDFDADVAAADPGFLLDGADPALQKARVFVLASNRSAYNEVLRLWRLWLDDANDKLPRNYGGLAEAFKYLNDVRPWGPADRALATGVAAFWEAGLAANDPTIRFEIELWCRNDPARRDAAYARVQAAISAAGGQCVKQVAIPEVDYHGVLVDLPAAAVQEAVSAIKTGGDTQVLRLTEIKYFAPLGQASINTMSEGAAVAPPTSPLPPGDPVVAILDGLPLANHAALQDRLIIDDPDNVASKYQLGEHRHGTAMASLVTCGEYDSGDAALGSKVYVRPVMQPGRPDVNNQRWETFPVDELAVDLIHRAVRRIFEPTGDTPAQAPSVKVINLSLGDKSQPFDRQISPWARLLDWLAWKYKVLFVVSSGNHLDDITVPVPANSLASLSDGDLRSHTLRGMAQQRVQRRLLSPAESINALTVGPLHSQKAPSGNAGNHIDLLRGLATTSPVGTVASGYRRSVKPEILVQGGRRYYVPVLNSAGTNSLFQITNATAQPGQLVAACHPLGTSNQYATRASGSSNAAALTTRHAAELVERIRELRTETGGDVLTDDMTAVILKAMLVHGASWDDRFDLFDAIFDGPDSGTERWWRIKRACAQFLGYGPADFDRGTVCTDQRVIALGCGTLKAEEGHVYSIPLPPALHAQTVMRRLTITLAWITPVSPRHRAYRVADLWFSPPATHLRVKRRDADHDVVTRGTVQHEVLEGESAVSIVDGDTMPVQVNCRPEAPTKESHGVPYALLVTLETANPLGVSIYDQVKAKLDALHAAVPVQPAARARAR